MYERRDSSYPAAAPTVIDAPTAQQAQTNGTERPGAGELFKIGLAASTSFFLAALMVAWAGGKPLEAAFRLALIVGGVSLGILWPGFILLYAGGGIGQMIDHWLLYRLRRHQIDVEAAVKRVEIRSQEMIRARETAMQRQIGMARAQIEADRQLVAASALHIASTREMVTGNHLPDPSERALVEAVLAAYEAADQDGYISNQAQAPFSKRALGEANYHEIVQRLADPGRRCGTVGTPWVAKIDPERRAWRLNIKAYPTPEDALMALTGRRRL